MDFKKNMIMKFNYITRIKELEDDNLYLANENMKLKKNIKNLKVEKEELEDDIIQLQSTKPVFQKQDLEKIRPKKQSRVQNHGLDIIKPSHTYNVKKSKGSISKGSISKDKKKMSRVDISIQNLVRAREVKAQKFNLKKQSLESTPLVTTLVNTHNDINSVPEPIPIPIQKTIMYDNDNDNDNDNEKTNKVIFIDSDSDCDLVNEFSFTS